MKGEFTRNLSVWNPTVGVASYVAAFSWYFFGLICWMRDDLPLLSSPSTRMCTSLSFFESAAVRRFNIAKYKKAQVKDTWMLPDAHPGLGGSEISGTLYCMRRQVPSVSLLFTVTGAQLRRPAESESRSRSLPRASPGRRKPDSRPIGRPLIRKVGPFGPRGILSTQRH